MKKVVRLIVAVLLLTGALSHVSLADGPGPQPTCDPTTDPNCKPPGLSLAR